MTSITGALRTEQVVFTTVFDSIERTLSKVQTVEEAKRLAGLVESLLRGHSEAWPKGSRGSKHRGTSEGHLPLRCRVTS